MTTDEVVSILTNFFELFAEKSTNNGSEIKIRGVGTLRAAKNRELIFENDSQEGEKLVNRNIRAHLNLIDNYSAGLSSGRGYAFSVRSSEELISSVITPRTKVSCSGFESSRSHKKSRVPVSERYYNKQKKVAVD